MWLSEYEGNQKEREGIAACTYYCQDIDDLPLDMISFSGQIISSLHFAFESSGTIFLQIYQQVNLSLDLSMVYRSSLLPLLILLYLTWLLRIIYTISPSSI
ncbi:hypothetical protein BCR42DRAFT_183044 [Absidia repens]|uniref:Uncharacterized protein n=1 Tax=Absidia repens TaxID=90262 RepID=A0A1X2HY42_9FUNG|nr:hypothetical protein BCR42DRAFT_183044 [Absidia repens]